MNNWRRTCLGILLAPFLFLLLLIAGTSLHAGWRHGQRLLSIQWVARQFGYSADGVSVRGRGCDNGWIDGQDCTLFLVFTSAQSLDEVKQAAQGRYINARGRTETVQELFQEVNYRTSHWLTLDGDAAIGENTIAQTIAVERINGWDAASAPSVTFYATQQLHNRLMLDHTPLDSNLILIEHSIGRISSLALFYWWLTPQAQPHNSPIVNLLLAAAPATGPALVVDLQENVYHPGESVYFTTAFVNDHALLTNAQITVTLLTPDGQTTYLPMTPYAYQVDGKPSHAVHTVKFSAPAVGGRSLIQVRASNATLVDETETEIFVVPISEFAHVEQVITERALDLNHDGYLEGIDIDLLVTIYTAAEYRARAWLSDKQQRALVSATTEFLSPPEQTLPNVQIIILHFSGSELHDAQVDGPYTLGEVTLASRLEINQVGHTPLPTPQMVWWDESFAVPHTTAAYTVDQFAQDQPRKH